MAPKSANCKMVIGKDKERFLLFFFFWVHEEENFATLEMRTRKAHGKTVLYFFGQWETVFSICALTHILMGHAGFIIVARQSLLGNNLIIRYTVALCIVSD